MRKTFQKSLWTVWRPVLRGSKSDDPAYVRPVFVGSRKRMEREKRLSEVKLGRLGLVAAKLGGLIHR